MIGTRKERTIVFWQLVFTTLQNIVHLLRKNDFLGMNRLKKITGIIFRTKAK